MQRSHQRAVRARHFRGGPRVLLLLTAEASGSGRTSVDQTVLSARADKVVVSSQTSAFAAQQLSNQDCAAGCAQVAKLATWVRFPSDAHAEGGQKFQIITSMVAKWKERSALLGIRARTSSYISPFSPVLFLTN